MGILAHGQADVSDKGGAMSVRGLTLVERPA